MKTRKSFFNQAKEHQQKFRESNLQLPAFDKYVTMLTDDDARRGKNFYTEWDGMMEAVMRRYKGFRKPLYKNMLRSEHIPFNFFVPLEQNKHDEKVVRFISKITGITDIATIEKIEFEKSPEKKIYLRETKGYLPLKEEEKFLADSTSFDVMLTYQADRGKGGIGIEVKYTEKSYPYGETEKRRMESSDENELYHLTHKNSGIYVDGSVEKLKTKILKQFWRNHLLGLRMIQKGLINEFVSVQLFPDSNQYQKEKSQEYHKQIIANAKSQFVPITYEKFIETGLEMFKEKNDFENWLKYLKLRYITDDILNSVPAESS